MRNLEGIKDIEVSEKTLEETSVKVSEMNADSFDDCALTEDTRLEQLRDEYEATYFEDCAKTDESIEEEENYDDCRKL